MKMLLASNRIAKVIVNVRERAQEQVLVAYAREETVENQNRSDDRAGEIGLMFNQSSGSVEWSVKCIYR